MWTREGQLLHTWNANCYIDVVNNPENNLIAYYTGNNINILSIDTKEVVKTLYTGNNLFNIRYKFLYPNTDDEKVRSITMSRDGQYLLANCSESDPVINLWNISQNKIVQKYAGHKQNKYILKCAFGGKFENYVVCGSEDDLIYIWNRSTGELLDTLKGHTDTVNCIAWSQHFPNFFISCSDDQTIKVWGVNSTDQVKVTIDPKFKSLIEDESGQNSENYQIDNIDDSESLGESSLSEGSVFSVDDDEPDL